MWGDSRFLPGIGGTSCRRLTQLQTPSPGRFSWRHQLREFQSRFHVVAVDLRGYGPSDAPKDVNCYTVDLLLADIKDVILGLGMSQCPIQERPLPSCTLISSSAPFGTHSHTSASLLLHLTSCPPGYSKCILVSHDWGAVLAWNFSIYFPSLVERMVVVSGPPMSVFQGALGVLGYTSIPGYVSGTCHHVRD